MSGSVQIAVTEPPVYVDANDRFHGTADIAGPGLAGRSPMTAAKGAELTQPTLKRHSDVRTRCQEAVTWSAVQACTSFSPSIRASQRDRITQRPRKRPADAAQSIFIFNRLFSSR